MKRTVKNLVAIVFCLSMVLATCVSAFALGTVSKPTATATYNSITLTWPAVSKADGYEVYVASGNSWKKLATTSSRTYTHKNLKINTTYKYRVRAYDKGVFKTTYGSFSSTASAKTALAKVTGLKVSAANSSAIKLVWNKVAGATGYQLYYYSNNKWVYKGKTTANSIKVAGKLGVTYRYAVRAYRTVSNKNYYGSFSSSIYAKCALYAPSGAKLGTVTATSAALSWNKVTGATGYQVYMKVGSNWVRQANLTATQYTLSKLTAGTNYNIRIRAFAKVSSGYVYSPVVEMTFRTVPGKIETVSVDAKGTYANLKWSKSAGADGYLVYRYNYTEKKWEREKFISTNSYKATNLTPETKYTFLVKPYHKANGSNLYGDNSPKMGFTTYFADFTSFTVSEVGTSLYLFKWTDLSKEKNDKSSIYYDLEYFDYTTNEWTPLYKDHCYSAQSHQTPKTNSFKAVVDPYGNATRIRYNVIPGATKYTVQIKSNYGEWENRTTVSPKSVKTYLAPESTYDIRVIANNGKYRVRACKETDGKVSYTQYLYLSNLFTVSSNIVTYTTPAVSFNGNDNEIKTIYTLKLVQAINNTKVDGSKFTLGRNVTLNASLGKCLADGKDISYLIEKVPGFKEEIESTFNEKSSNTWNFENGVAPYTYTDKDGNLQNGYISINRVIAPSEERAYFYKQDDVANFSKKISSISVTTNANGTQSFVVKLAKETASAGKTTPVHDGFMDSFAKELASADDTAGASIAVGETVIKATVSKNCKLDYMKIESPFVVSMGGLIQGINFEMSLNGKAQYEYTITR